MAEEGLKIKIGADVQSAISNINDLNNTLVKTNDTAAEVGSNGMKQLTQGTGKANIALTNFSRVVQDAPFGIIGIANNIDPLITSFQNLRKETGSSGAAFKSLLSGLTGPAGIAIGISTVTSLLVAFGPKIADFINGVSESEKALQGISGEAAESFRKAQLEFDKLSQIITSSSSTYDQQVNALDKVNNSLSGYGLQIQNVAAFQKNASQIGILFAQIKQEEARGLALAAESAKEYARQVIAQSVVQQANAKIADAANKGVSELQFAWTGLINSIKEYNAQSDITSSVNNQKVYNAAINQSNANLQNLLGQLGKIPGVTAVASNSQKGLTKATNTTSNTANKLADILQKYREGIKAINWDEQNRGIDGTKKRLELAGETLRSLYLAGVRQSAKSWKEVQTAYTGFEKKFKEFLESEELKKLQEFIQKYKDGIAELDIRQAVTGQDQLNARINLTIEALIELRKKGKENTDQYKELQDTLNSLQADLGLRAIKKRSDEINESWQKYRKQVDNINLDKTKSSIDVLKNKIDLIGKTIEDLRGKGLTEDDLGIKLLRGQLLGLSEAFDKLKAQQEIFDTIRQSIEGGLTNAFSSVFDAIADGEDVFKALGNSIKRLALDLIKTIIQLTVVKTIANTILPGIGGQASEKFATTIIRGDQLRNITFVR